MGQSLFHKIIETHLSSEEHGAGQSVDLNFDQVLLQDATGTLVMLTLEALDIERVQTETAVQYVDHNLLQANFRNAEDHAFLESAAKRYGLWYSRPGNGVSHPLHMSRFSIPGKTLIGSDSHTCASGALGMLAIGAGGLDAAMVLAGEPYSITMPELWKIELKGELPDWVSAKDVILELLRRHGVSGGIGRVLEYQGDGLRCLSAMDRHVIANMGAELGATASLFPSDITTKEFLKCQGREDDWQPIAADSDAEYAAIDVIELDKLEPLIAMPSSPGNVVAVETLEGRSITQAYIGSSANPGINDFMRPAAMVEGKYTPPEVSFDISPTSRALLSKLSASSALSKLLEAGARLHQAGCNGCIGMGQAPAKNGRSLRTTPRNFPGRSGTTDDAVYLCSPETATASALAGQITDPRKTRIPYPKCSETEPPQAQNNLFAEPLEIAVAKNTDLVKGENISTLPEFEDLPNELSLPILLVLEDDVSTDEIMPAGAEVLPYRSNIPEIAKYVFRDVDGNYPSRCHDVVASGHAVLAGRNYGQGSSREHAALAPRSLGLRAVLARSFSRIHRANLINYGVLPLLIDETTGLQKDDVLHFYDLREAIADVGTDQIKTQTNRDGETTGPELLTIALNEREREIILAGGRINHYRQRKARHG
tara:strand:- start:12465 stop:14423 length:1959 start_codon:yes stop_codon:yes gene_type:complete